MKLAILTSHPVQYYAPWFRHIARSGIELRVFYLWDSGNQSRFDPGFGRDVAWDIPLLEGYDHEFVPNRARDPGTHHFAGLHHPQLRERVAGWRPDAVLLIGYAWRSFMEFALRWKRSRAPLLLRGDSHRLVPDLSWRGRVKDRIIRHLFSRYSAFLHCGTANREYFLHHGARPGQLFYCPHAIDMDRFQATPPVAARAADIRREWQIPGEDRVVLFAGKLEEKKRPLDLLVAFQNLSPERTTLVFVGSGGCGDALRRQAGKDPRVRFVPFHNQSTMPAVYAAADLFVLPSFGPRETWGLAVQEALACGIPALVSNHVGCHPDLIHPDVNGAVFPAGNIPALEQALARALEPGTLQRWGQAARSSLDRHTYHQATVGLQEALRSLE